MIEDNYITASCVIHKNAVHKNGRVIFESSEMLPSFLISMYNHFQINYPKFYKMDNMSKLGWLASEILLKDDFISGNYLPEDIGIVMSNANSSLDTDMNYYETVKDMPSPGLFVYTLPNIVIGEICIRNNFKGENAFFVSAHFDADFLYHYVSHLFSTKTIKACICGWVDVLGEDYKAVLMLIEKDKATKELFSKEHMVNIFTKSGQIPSNLNK